MKNGGKNLKKTGYESEKSVTFLAEKIIENALNLRATDVHIEPREDHTLVRFRIHGTLQDFEKLPPIYSKKLAKHFKSLGELDFGEKIFSQTAKIKHGKANIRISVSPTFLGEKITLRVMSAKHKVRSLEEIGLWGDNLRRVRQAIRQPSGILITIGAGKNNTNFAILNEIISSEKNIVTVEKHIEKGISKINQTEVKPRIGLDYPQATKAALSQNPDVILIDDLRDKKTAELAFDASSRGKFVIISLPVQKTSEAIPYLEFLGVPSFMIATNVLAIISQKLIRTVSPQAVVFQKINKTESKVLLNEFKISASHLNNLEKSAKKYFEGKKLRTNQDLIVEIPVIDEKFAKTAFIGLTGIFEVVSFLDGKFGRELKNLVSLKPNSAEIEDFLEDFDFSTLKIDGIVKALQGQTTIKEVIRQTGY